MCRWPRRWRVNLPPAPTPCWIRPSRPPGAALLQAVGAYAIAYAWSGDARYACYARDSLRALNRRYADGYGDWHYAIERIIRAIPWLSAGGFLDSADLFRTDALLLGTALGTQHMWWRMTDGKPPLGHRHHGKGTMAFYLQARYLLDHAVLNEAGRQLCERWAAECRDVPRRAGPRAHRRPGRREHAE